MKNYWIGCVCSQVNERMVKEFRAPDSLNEGRRYGKRGKAGKEEVDVNTFRFLCTDQR